MKLLAPQSLSNTHANTMLEAFRGLTMIDTGVKKSP